MTKITKAEFEALPESLKAKFKAEGDDYILQEEDVDGLKKSKAEILEEKKRIQVERDELAKFKADHEKAASETEEEKLKAAGEFKQLEEKLRAKITEVETARDTQIGQIKSNLKTERLKNLLIENGVLADRADYALTATAEQFELVSDDAGFSLKLKDGIGGADEIKAAVEGLKTKAPFLFAANNASGSGASGGNNSGGAQTPKTATRAELDQMSATAKRDFYLNDGEPSD